MVKAGVRYGAELRKRAAAVDAQRTARYPCPTCGKTSVKRRGNSLWECRSCGSRFAGGAYSLTTATGEAARRSLESVRGGARK